MKKYIALTLFFVLSFATLAFGANYDLYFDGNLVDFEKEPINSESRVFYPMRELMETFGATVSWDAPTETATATLGEDTVKFKLKSSSYTLNGETLFMDNGITPIVVDGSMYLPVRYLAESFSFLVGWDPSLYAVVVDSENYYLNNPELADENDRYILKFYVQYLNTVSELLDLIDDSAKIEDKKFYTKTTLNYIQNANKPEASAKIKPYEDLVLDINEELEASCNEALSSGDFDSIDLIHEKINKIITDSANYSFFK